MIALEQAQQHRNKILSFLLLGVLIILLAACSGATTTQSPSTNTTQSSLQRSMDQPGNNTFTVSVKDAQSGKAATDAQVQMFTTMLDMAMDTDSANLQANGNGQYSTQGELSMAGKWQIGIQVRTSDSQLHKAQINISTQS